MKNENKITIPADSLNVNIEENFFNNHMVWCNDGLAITTEGFTQIEIETPFGDFLDYEFFVNQKFIEPILSDKINDSVHILMNNPLSILEKVYGFNDLFIKSKNDILADELSTVLVTFGYQPIN